MSLAGGGDTPGLLRLGVWTMPNRPRTSNAVRARHVLDAAPGEHVNRNLAIVAVLMILGIAAWWTDQEKPHAGAVARDESEDSRFAASGWSDDAARDSRPATGGAAPAAAQDESSTGFETYVDRKYRYLFRGGMRAAQTVELRAALLERERMAVVINTARQGNDAQAKETLPQQLARLAELDRKIAALLPAAALAAFDVLKDSDIEQFQIDDYAGGISNVAPLSNDDKQSILYTKLVYRQRFRQALEASGLLGGALGTAERRFAFVEVSRALKESRDGFLQEVRQYLYDDQQYSLLSNYENSEYTAELAKLRTMAYGD